MLIIVIKYSNYFLYYPLNFFALILLIVSDILWRTMISITRMNCLTIITIIKLEMTYRQICRTMLTASISDSPINLINRSKSSFLIPQNKVKKINKIQRKPKKMISPKRRKKMVKKQAKKYRQEAIIYLNQQK